MLRLLLPASSPDLPTHISDGVPTRLSQILCLLSLGRDRGWGPGAEGEGRGHRVPRGSVSHLRDPPWPSRPPAGTCLGPQLSCPSPRCSRAESVELKPGHGERKSYITGRSREGRVETGTHSAEGAPRSAKSTGASGEDTLGMERILVCQPRGGIPAKKGRQGPQESPEPSRASP